MTKKKKRKRGPGPTDFREIILDRLKAVGKSRNWLANCGAVAATPNSVNRYLRGTHDSRGVYIAQMLDVLGIKVGVRE